MTCQKTNTNALCLHNQCAISGTPTVDRTDKKERFATLCTVKVGEKRWWKPHRSRVNSYRSLHLARKWEDFRGHRVTRGVRACVRVSSFQLLKKINRFPWNTSWMMYRSVLRHASEFPVLVKRQAMSLWRNTEASPRNLCCRGIATTVTYSERVCIQHAKRMRCTYLLWPVWLYHIFPHCLTNGTIFGREKMSLNIKCTFWFLHNFIWNISHFNNNSARHYQKFTYILM
jgi:hypothetical protein